MKTLDQKPEVEVSLRMQALDDLQRAWKSIRRLEDLSDDVTESNAAGRVVKLLDDAFHELERGNQ